MSDCSCCSGGAPREAATPAPFEHQLAHRAGTYASFFEAMRAGLAAAAERTPAAGDAACCLDEPLREALAGGADDAATALLDGFACVADVLTFYQERILNEAYLRTATEERSLLELGRLTGYAPRPGAAADVEVAFTLQAGFDGVIPERTKLQSQPRPGQDAQTFETREALPARAEWNAMRVRRRSSQRYVNEELAPGRNRTHERTGRIELFLAGVEQNVRVGDLVLLERPQAASESEGWQPSADDLFRVTKATPDLLRGHTTLRLVPTQKPHAEGFWADGPTGTGLRQLARGVATATNTAQRAHRGGVRARVDAERALALMRAPVDPHRPDPSRQEAAARLRTLESKAVRMALRAPGGDRLLSDTLPEPLRRNLRTVLAQTAAPVAPRAYVFRTVAQAFGHNAPKRALVIEGEGGTYTTSFENEFAEDEQKLANGERTNGRVVFLDGDHPRLQVHGRIVVAGAASVGEGGATTPTLVLANIVDVQQVARNVYGLNGRATRVTLDKPWRTVVEPPSDLPSAIESAASIRAMALELHGPPTTPKNPITPLRDTLFHIDADALHLLPMPVEDDVHGGVLSVDGTAEPLPIGRRLIVEGEVVDQPELAGVRHAEVVYVAESYITTEDADDAPSIALPPDRAAPPAQTGTPATAVAFSPPLMHRYRRESVVVYGNVAAASHGETREHTLGSGDAALASQTFALRGKPRTWLQDPLQPHGVASTLEVRVNGILWPELTTFLDAGPRDQGVLTRTAADGFDRVGGGDGKRGARFPTGLENVTARYRVGLGPAGNVKEGAIITLGTKPLGVQSVINPRAARGGAAPDDATAMRARIPIGARGEDRLVSIRDYEDFALSYAGIEQARAVATPDAQGRPSVLLVVAGAEDTPLDLAKLPVSLRRFGDPGVRVDVREARFAKVQLEASLRIDARRRWEDVAAAARAQLIAQLGFARRTIGASLALSEVLSVVQSVPGVQSIDVNAFASLGGTDPLAPLTPSERAKALEHLLAPADGDASPRPPARIDVDPDVLLYVAKDAPESLSLTEMAP